MITLKMIMNFLHHLFQTKVECSVVSSDGYSQQNLISSSWRERNQGFMAAHFIKPPVYLLFQFAFPIRVHSLVVKPKVGSQISTGIDVFVAGIRSDGVVDNVRCETSKKRNRSRREMTTDLDGLSATSYQEVDNPKTKMRRTDSKNTIINEEKNIKPINTGLRDSQPSVSIPMYNFSTVITTDSFKNEHRNLFTLVSRINEHDGRTTRVINRRYRGSMMPCVEEDIGEYNFFQGHVLGYVTHLVICISRTKGSCVPAVGRVEVLGQPSSSCDRTIHEYVTGIQNQIIQESTTPEPETKNTPETRETECKDEIVDDDEIPSDFIDPITCKLMTIPMLLPSGLNIDMTTLEKHMEAERQWGRQPSDPFTGVIFTSSTKPLPNCALKVRIDKYILSSGIDVNNYGRTIGRSSSNNHGDVHKRPIRPRSDENRTELKRKPNCETKSGTANIGNENGDGFSKTSDVESQNGVVQSHEEKISQSLDSALMKTLQGATFVRKPRPSQNSSTGCSSSLVKTHVSNISPASTSGAETSEGLNCCVQCKVALDTTFRLPCQHLMCRKCLLLKTSSNKNATCPLCDKSFVHKEVIRVHTV